jgi:sec-independent protein translocase protein TatC
MKRLLRLLTLPFRVLFAPFRWLWGRLRAVRDFFTVAPEDTSLTETIGDALESTDALKTTLAGMGEHLEALRGHLFRAVLTLAVTTTVSFLYAGPLLQVLAVPMGDNVEAELLGLVSRTPQDAFAHLAALGAQGLQQMQVIEPTESIGVFMRVALLAGVALAMPWIILELYLFIAPGLMPRSRITLMVAIPAATLLFLAGMLFTYFIMLPAAVPFLRDFMGFRAAWRPSAYYGLITSLMFWIGVSFQMPLIIYALAAVGLVQAKQLAEYWRFAIVAIAIIAAAVTPTVDPVNMALVMLPMILLYFFSIAGAWVAQLGRRHDAAQKKKAAGTP